MKKTFRKMNVALHSQTLNNRNGVVAGSEITTNGLASAFSQLEEIEKVYRFSPDTTYNLPDTQLDLVIIEGWNQNISTFIEGVRNHSETAIILFWNLSFFGFNEIVKLNVDGFLCNSKKVTSVLNKIKPSKFVMLGVDASVFKPKVPVDGYKSEVAYLGMFHPDKSDKVVKLILEEAAGSNLAIYGTGWGKHPLLKKCWKGKLPSRDIPKLYSSAAIVLGTTEDRQRKVGMINNRVFEALSCGALFISEHFPELEAVFGDVIFYTRKPGGTASIVSEILKNPNQYLEKRKKGRQLILQEHTFAHRVTQILNFYHLLKE